MKVNLLIVLVVLLALAHALLGAEEINNVWWAHANRRAKLQPNLRDWEISAGLETQRCQLSLLSERENGQRYKGHRVFYEPYSFLQFERVYKGAYDMDTTSVRALFQPYPEAPFFEYFKVGGSLNSDHLQDPTGFVAISFNSKRVTAAVEFNRDDTVVWYKAGIPLYGRDAVLKRFREDTNFYLDFYTEANSGYGKISDAEKTIVGWRREGK